MSIHIEDLTVRFKNSVTAIDHADLDIPNGIFGLLGENGAGKTTLMRVLTTVLKPTNGMVTLDGILYSEGNYEKIQRKIGYLPQEIELYPNLTVQECLEYMGDLAGVPKAECRKRIDYYLKKTSLIEHRKKKMKQLSGGMKRRVGLVQALLNEPEFLIVDEPTTGLDPEERIRIRNLLVDFSENRTVLFSTHVVEDLAATCNQLAIMHKGRFLYAGSMKNLTEEAQGKIWICKVPDERKAREVEQKYRITVRDINKLLRNCFEQAVKWELMEKNPCTHATVPKHKSQKRDIWTADTLMYALSVCEDERLKLAINLSFSCSLRLGELLGLTWDCVDISHEAIEENRAYVFINKESQRIRKESLNALDGKDVLLVFPTNHKKNSTVRILKTPKTESSVRKIFLPKSVANMLVDWKAEQDEMKEILGDEYMDYNLVMASTFGLPLGDGAIRGPLKKLIEDYNLPPVVFHSFRHSSVTYKLKLNGGDIKAVQGDSGHAQVNMVTDVYSHILDDDRRKNAELFEEAFYEKKNLDPQMHVQQENNNTTVADEVDPELLAKVLANPEMRALLNSLAKTMK